MYKSYYKSGYQPQSKYRMAQRYIKNRVAQNIAASRGPLIPKTIIYKKTAEKKGMDTRVGSVISNILATTNTNGGIVALNLVQTGNGSWNRVGKTIDLKSLRISGILNLNNSDPTFAEPVVVRMCIVWDKQPSGVLPTFQDIFGSTNQDGTETTQFLDSLRYDNVGRFRTLLDKRYTLNPGFNPGAASQNVACDINEYIKLNNLKTIFSGQSIPMTIADISTGALYIVFRASTQTAKATAQLDADCVCRLRYTD